MSSAITRSGLALFGVAVMAAVFTVALNNRMMRVEKRQHLEAAVAETAAAVAAQLEADLEHLDRMLVEAAAQRTTPSALQAATSSATTTTVPGTSPQAGLVPGSIDFDPDVLAISLWNRAENGAASRVSQILNRRHVTLFQETLLRQTMTESVEREAVQAAIDSNSTLRREPGLEPEGGLVHAFPIPPGLTGGSASVKEWLVVHIRPGRLERALRWDGSSGIRVVNADGTVVGRSDRESVRGEENLRDEPWFREIGSSGLSSGQLVLSEGSSTPRKAIYYKVRTGKLVVLMQVPEPDAYPPFRILLVHGVFFAFVYVVFLLAAVLAYRLRGGLPGGNLLGALFAASFGSASPASAPAPLGEGPEGLGPSLESGRGGPVDSGPKLLPVRPLPALSSSSIALVFPNPVVAAALGGGPDSEASAPVLREPRGPGAGTADVATPQPSSAPSSEPRLDSPVAPGEGTGETAADHRVVVVLHGMVLSYEDLLKTPDPREAARAVNDWLATAAGLVKHFGGTFETGSGSFTAVWGMRGGPAPGQPSPNDQWSAIRCALELRRDFAQLNELLKTDGQRPLVYGMGIDSGMALTAKLGAEGDSRPSVVGDVLACTRKLSSLAYHRGSDLLVSGEVWQESREHFLGARLGEARLTSNTGLKEYFGVTGYLDEQGQEVFVNPSDSLVTPLDERPIAPPETEPTGSVARPETAPQDVRWLVNNGSQIVGPLAAPEIAARLFSQELDFDCECWREGSGSPSKIRDSGIFTGSSDSNATLWVYDGTTIHGPVTAGFVRTAIMHGAFMGASEEGEITRVFICDQSTVNGWLRLGEWESSNGSGSGPAAA